MAGSLAKLETCGEDFHGEYVRTCDKDTAQYGEITNRCREKCIYFV